MNTQQYIASLGSTFAQYANDEATLAQIDVTTNALLNDPRKKDSIIEMMFEFEQMIKEAFQKETKRHQGDLFDMEDDLKTIAYDVYTNLRETHPNISTALLKRGIEDHILDITLAKLANEPLQLGYSPK